MDLANFRESFEIRMIGRKSENIRHAIVAAGVDTFGNEQRMSIPTGEVDYESKAEARREERQASPERASETPSSNRAAEFGLYLELANS